MEEKELPISSQWGFSIKFLVVVCGILLNSETIDFFFHISTIVCQAKSIDVMCWKKPSSDPTACKPHQVHES